MVVVNSKAKTTRPRTLEILVQEQNLKLKIEKKKTIYIRNCLRIRTQIMYVHYELDLLKQEWNVGYAVDGFITNLKELQRKEYLKNTHVKHNTSV